jgi:hypothetical protein
MSKKKRVNIGATYNRFSLVGVVLTVTLVGTTIFTLVNMVVNYMFLPENNLLQLISSEISGPLAFASILALSYGWMDRGALLFSGVIIGKDIRYLGIRTIASTGQKRFSACADEKQIKPNPALLGWFACSSKWDGKTNLHKRFYVANHDVCMDLPDSHFVANQILYILKQERDIIRALKREKSYDKDLFVSGLPLATYLLLCSGYEDSEKRALIFKRNEVLPLRAYLLNKIAETAEGLEELIELPNRWLYEATGYEYEKAFKSRY